MDPVQLGDRIMDIRVQRGYTQSEMAQLIGITSTHYKRIESGRYVPRVDLVKKISDVLGCTIDYLLED